MSNERMLRENKKSGSKKIKPTQSDLLRVRHQRARKQDEEKTLKSEIVDTLQWEDFRRENLVDLDENEKASYLKAEQNKKYLTKIDSKTIEDPYAMFRPQDLHYVMGKYKGKYFSIMWGTDEGLTPGEYDLSISDTKKGIKSFAQMLDDPDLDSDEGD